LKFYTHKKVKINELLYLGCLIDLLHGINGSQDSLVGIATSYRLDCQVSVPGGGKIFLSHIGFRPALGPTQPIILKALSLGIKRLGHKAGHPPSFSAEVMIGEPIPPLPHTSSWHNA
jgi:hypothetical protein